MLIAERNAFLAARSGNKEEEMYKELFTALCNGTLVEIDDDKITTIRSYLFVACPNLVKVRMSALTSIQYSAAFTYTGMLFHGCNNLEVVDFPALKNFGSAVIFNMSDGKPSKLRLLNLPALTYLDNYRLQYIGDTNNFAGRITVNLDSLASIAGSLAFTRTGHLDIHLPLFSANSLMTHTNFPFSDTSFKITNKFFCSDGVVEYDTTQGVWVQTPQLQRGGGHKRQYIRRSYRYFLQSSSRFWQYAFWKEVG